MGVAPDVTPEDLKKAYRRKALQLHPDKRGNTPEAQEEFMLMKNAYDILNDPKQREIYDMMGEDGVKLVHQYGDLSPDELLMAMLNSLAQSGPMGKCIIFSFVAFFLGFFTLIPLFICLKVDQDIGWSWITVFVPMWILDGIVLCCVGGSFCGQDSDIHQEPEDRQSTTVRVVLKLLLLVKVLLFVGFQVLVAMKLQGSIPAISIPVVFAPYFVLEGFYLIEKIITGILSYAAFAAATANDPAASFGQSRMSLILDIVNSWMMSILRLSFGFLVAFKLDKSLDVSWWIVFVPVWIYVFTLLIQTYARRNKQKERRSNDGNEDESDEQDSPSLLGLICIFLGIFIFMSPFFILAYRLQSADFSAFYVLLPWLIIVGIALLPWIIMVILGILSCFCGLCCGRPQRRAESTDATEKTAPPESSSPV
ncbi:hypothetical protein LEN26_015587 [Aphanomyces euteiches]|nr:hypothetical protein LEN26_015587 [Aphanomyces euteiches]KAH9108667.1 hypothetical protein AeMF1_016160 [Aphanomyces euteiches]KAH9194481.1 hypothetical protein AeNC1_003558 [Aphanomyces euteiches]